MDNLKANQFRMPAPQTENVKITPVLVKFSKLDIARKVFIAKSKLTTELKSSSCGHQAMANCRKARTDSPTEREANLA